MKQSLSWRAFSHFIFYIMSARAASSLSSPASRVALVTGANKGIGKEIVRKLGQEDNLTCILACRDLEKGTTCAEELKAAGCRDLRVVRLDLTDASSIEAAAQYVDKEFGQLDILVNNAAICFNDPTLYGKVPFTPFEAQADITICTNFFGTLHVIQAMLPYLKKIFLSSHCKYCQFGRTSFPPAFAGTKTGLFLGRPDVKRLARVPARICRRRTRWPPPGTGLAQYMLWSQQSRNHCPDQDFGPRRAHH